MRIVLANADCGVWAVLSEYDAILFLGSRSECERYVAEEADCICVSY